MSQHPLLSAIGMAGAPLAQRMRELQIPGVSIAVMDGGQIDWAAGFGECQAGTGRPVTPDTLFQAASISKPVFALGVLRLVEQGVLDLDRDVNVDLKSWRLPPVAGWQPRITLRHLLTHTAGLTVHGFPGYSRTAPLPSLPQILDGLAPANTQPVRVDTVPGLHLRYSGGGTTVAQLLVEDVVGRPLAPLMRELVLGPLGLRHSTYLQPLPETLHGQAAAGHENGKAVDGSWHVYPEQAAAGLWTTPTELARIVLAVRRAWRGEDESFLRRETVREMLRPQPGEAPPGRGPMGIGYFLAGDPPDYLRHTGGNKGFVCNHKLALTSGHGYVMMTNAAGAIGLCTEVELAVAREYGWPGYFPAVSSFGGQYAWPGRPEFPVTVTADGALLQIDLPGQGRLPAVHVGHGCFTAIDTGIVVTFGPGRMTLTQNEKSITLPKRP